MANANSNKINPFYISQNEAEDDYSGWDDWSEDDEEEQMSLMQRRPGRRDENSVRNAHHHRHSKRRGDYPVDPQNMKYFAVVVVGFLLLILFTGGSGNDGTTYNKSHNRTEDPSQGSAEESGVGEFSHENVELQHLVVIGERRSGVTWMQEKFKGCFPDAHISLSLQRKGYFFQEDPSAMKHPSVVVHMVLNAYDWLEQMRNHPKYMPNHQQENGHPLAWRDFVTKNWTMERPKRDLPHSNETGTGVCQLGFEYHRVVSCIKLENNKNTRHGKDNPIYELKPNGEPYSSILELREAKLQNHQSVQDWDRVPYFFTVRYEEVGNMEPSGEHTGFEHLLRKIEAATGWERSCLNVSMVEPPSLSLTTTMSLEFVDHVRDSLNWEVEGTVGYSQWGSNETDSFNIQHEQPDGDDKDSKGKPDDTSDTEGEVSGSQENVSTERLGDGAGGEESREKTAEDSDSKNDPGGEETGGAT